jgi:hypothetical protein
MNLLQLTLPLFEHFKNRPESQKTRSAAGKRSGSTSRYYKTQELLKLLRLEKPNAALRSARARNGAYRHDHYVAVHVAHDKWELFRRYSVREISA